MELYRKVISGQFGGPRDPEHIVPHARSFSSMDNAKAVENILCK